MKRLRIDFLAEYDDASVLAELRRLAGASASGTIRCRDRKIKARGWRMVRVAI